MTRINSKNEKIKRKYLRRLREAEGLAEQTVLGVEKAICLYEDFTGHEDYARFNQNKAVGIKKWLLKRTHNGELVATQTVYYYLRHLKRFLTWLSDQPGYKSKINMDSVSYLSLDRKKVREAGRPIRHHQRNVDPRTGIPPDGRPIIALPQTSFSALLCCYGA